MMKKESFFALIALFLAFTGCNSVKHVKCNEVDPLINLEWLRQKVADIEAKGAENSDAEIYRYMYYNRPVFYISGRCCDVPNEVFDCQGNKICEPDGGVAGIGDGQCADFFSKREDGIHLYPPRNKKL